MSLALPEIDAVLEPGVALRLKEMIDGGLVSAADAPTEMGGELFSNRVAVVGVIAEFVLSGR